MIDAMIRTLLRVSPDGDGGSDHGEIWLPDPDDDQVVPTSPDGTVDEDWRS